jgi:hypothetical protein
MLIRCQRINFLALTQSSNLLSSKILNLSSNDLEFPKVVFASKVTLVISEFKKETFDKPSFSNCTSVVAIKFTYRTTIERNFTFAGEQSIRIGDITCIEKFCPKE